MILAVFTVVAVALAIFASPLLGVVILAVGCVLYFSDRQRRGSHVGTGRSR
jgi:uncharacterized oligopeptide transporter (OPT) family protein